VLAARDRDDVAAHILREPRLVPSERQAVGKDAPGTVVMYHSSQAVAAASVSQNIRAIYGGQ
jgi:hypothetical protein